MIGLLLATSALFVTKTGDDSLAAVEARGVLRYGGDAEGGAPFCFQDPNDPDKIIGFEIDLAALLGRELGVRAEFVQCDWKNLVPTLERGEIDLAWNGLEKDEELAERVRLTAPYFVFTETLAVRPDDARSPPLDSLPSLDGVKVGTLTNTLAHKLLRARPAIEVVQYDDDVSPYSDLMKGRIDAVVLDNVIANRHLEEGIRIANPNLLRAFYVGAVRKQDEALGAAIDGAIARIVASGELRAVMTLLLSIASFAIAMMLGLLLCLAKAYGSWPLRWLASGYIELYRGTPILLQLYVLYFGIAEVVRLPALVAAIVGLAMNYAAYEAEVYRAGLLSVPPGQVEAAHALGLGRAQTLRLVVFPQAFRIALPPMANDFIALLKDTSIVSVITVVELTKQYSITAHDLGSWLVPGALCALLYFAMSYPLTLLARSLERRFQTS